MSLLNQSLELLDDDCVREILARDEIDVEEMLEIASTCARFQQLAQQIFPLKFVQINHWDKMENWPLEKVERYLRYFGENYSTFDVNFTPKPDAVLRLLKLHCKNLVNLRCSGYGHIAFIELEQLFSRLVQYEQSFGLFVALRLFGKKSPLEKLALNNCTVYFPERCMPKLQHIKLNAVQLKHENSKKFFQLNPQIIRLEVYDPCSTINLNNIAQLENLEEFLYFTDLRTNKNTHQALACFRSLIKLRKLQLRASNNCILQILEGLLLGDAPLESLSLEFIELHISIIQKICKNKSIKQLQLRVSSTARPFEQCKLMEIVSNMPQLEHIHCDTIKIEDVHGVLRDSKNIHSALFIVRLPNLDRDYSTIISDISQISRARNILVDIEILSYRNLVSDQHNIFDLKSGGKYGKK